MRVAVRVWRGVKGFETKGRVVEGLSGRNKWVRGGFGRRAEEEGRKRGSRGLAFMV